MKSRKQIRNDMIEDIIRLNNLVLLGFVGEKGLLTRKVHQLREYFGNAGARALGRRVAREVQKKNRECGGRRP